MNAREIAAALGGRWRGRYGMCRCPAHADRRPSLSVADGADGRLLLHCFGGCLFEAILTALRAEGLVPDDGARTRWAPPDPAEVARRGRERREAARRVRELVHRIWTGTRPAAGTLAEVYLRGRGLDLPPPRVLRFALLPHRPSGGVWPCLVAAVQDGRGRLAGVYRTFIRPDGVGKAPVEPARMALGHVAGGAVRLAPAGPTLALAEGIEDGLSIIQESRVPAWAALGTANLARIELPPVVRDVIICADADPAGEAAAWAAARAYLAAGRAVRIARPPAGVKDFNELLRAGAHAGRAA